MTESDNTLDDAAGTIAISTARPGFREEEAVLRALSAFNALACEEGIEDHWQQENAVIADTNPEHGEKIVTGSASTVDEANNDIIPLTGQMSACWPALAGRFDR